MVIETKNITGINLASQSATMQIQPADAAGALPVVVLIIITL